MVTSQLHPTHFQTIPISSLILTTRRSNSVVVLLDLETLVVTTSGDHGFLTGDAVIYKPGVIKSTTISPDGITITTETESKFENVDENVYYIKRESSTSFKLARSRS